ncbi:hypothetical protein MNBD_NITROSPINAE01-1078 [hydrothermal vent metagenome]|uniref:SxtJ n=1 Tax=hydrothermal vent metagenome TaxID=652676 RepID=A0A3B1CGX3_9ZZZZ
MAGMGETKREVRITWAGFAVIFGVIASLLLYKGRATYPYFFSASGFFAFFAAFAPMALLPLYRLWMKFAMALAWFNTRLLLGITFYFVITPVGLFMRLLGKDLLDLKIDRDAKSYWKKREPVDDLSRYEKQY